MWILIWVGFLLIGIAVLIPLYAGLLTDFKKYNPSEFSEIGSPTLFMFSPRRKLRLQRFIYSGSKKEGIHPLLRKKCLLVGFVTPVIIFLIFALLFWAVRMESVST